MFFIEWWIQSYIYSSKCCICWLHLTVSFFMTFFLYQVDSVAEEVERQKSTNDMVNCCKLLESPCSGFIWNYIKWMMVFPSQILILHWVYPWSDCTGFYIWRDRPIAFRCYFIRCCKGFWGSSGAFFNFNWPSVMLNLICYRMYRFLFLFSHVLFSTQLVGYFDKAGFWNGNSNYSSFC